MKLPSILLTIILISAAAVFAQPRRGGPPVHRGPAPAAKAAVVSVYDPLSDFAKKGLPKAYVFGGIPNKALARNAAEMILKGDEDSLPALIGALQIAGFHITDSNQKILFKPLKANGTAFADYEVAGMLRSSFLGMGTTLEKLGKAFANDSPALKRFNIGAAMLADIESARSSGDEQNRFLADLIFELGRDTQGLTTPQSKINMIQASLIDRRFLGDVVDAYEAVSGGQAVFEPKDRLNGSAAGYFVNASFSPAAPFASLPVDSPCPGTETAEQAAGYKSKLEKIAKF
ncbi:MAG TPA: hypothetical protein VGQ55_17280, partial [Pyrinomonadaceae bacterium]|nr:hypothetical protein [Pyrinomonadaceae bacterium]